MAVRRLTRSGWYVDIRWKGQRIRRKSPLNTRAGAQQYEATLRQRLANGLALDEPVEAPVPTLREFAELWFTSYAVPNNKASTCERKEEMLRLHILPALGGQPLDAITRQSVDAFKGEMIRKGLAPKTINDMLGVLHTCLRHAVEVGHLDKLPPVERLAYQAPPIRFLTAPELGRLIAAAKQSDPALHDMLVLAVRTGLRYGELAGLMWDSVELGHGVLTVRRSLRRGVVSTLKGKRVRYVPLGEDLIQLLKPQPGERSFVFSTEDGSPITYGSALYRLHRLCDAAELPRIGWHALRHTFGAHLSSLGAPVRTIQELLGHQSINMTMRYTQVNSEDKRRAVALLTTIAPSGQSVGNRQ